METDCCHIVSSSCEQLTTRGQAGKQTILMNSVRPFELNKYSTKNSRFVYTHNSQAIHIHQMSSPHDINRLKQTFKTDKLNRKDNNRKKKHQS